jgi:hypothetical protein
VLLGGAAIWLAVTWLVPLALPPADRTPWEALRGLGAVPAAIWGFTDAWLAWARKREIPRRQEIEDDVYEVLRQIETLAVEHGVPIRLSECGVKVWALGRRSLRDVARRKGNRETRAPLGKVVVSPLYRATSSSGMRWRMGMGVIGVALQSNDVLAVDVNEAWGPIRSCTQSQWDAQPETTRLGLTYEEFQRLCRNGSSSGPAGPFVCAVPYYAGSRPLGVVALDMPAAAAASIDLGGADFDAGDRAVTSLMCALGKRVFEQ